MLAERVRREGFAAGHRPRGEKGWWGGEEEKEPCPYELHKEVLILTPVSGVPDSPSELPSNQVEEKFARLRDEWKSGRGHHSDTAGLVLHPAYQKIIGMGPVVIPLLLRELATKPDRWYWALRAITEFDPVPAEDRGNSRAMAEAWLEWGKEHGYIR